MGLPISIRLDDDVRDELETQAPARGIGLATLLRDLDQAARETAEPHPPGQRAVGSRVAASAKDKPL